MKELIQYYAFFMNEWINTVLCILYEWMNEWIMKIFFFYYDKKKYIIICKFL